MARNRPARELAAVSIARTSGEGAALVEAGKFRPWLDERRFTLATIDDAHARVASGQARVKVVVDVG